MIYSAHIDPRFKWSDPTPRAEAYVTPGGSVVGLAVSDERLRVLLHVDLEDANLFLLALLAALDGKVDLTALSADKVGTVADNLTVALTALGHELRDERWPDAEEAESLIAGFGTEDK